MARVTDFFAQGTIEHVVLYRRMGKNCSRIKRTHINQTPATKKRGINFGISARAARGLRNGLQPVMPQPKDRSMQSRFSGAIAKWLALQEVSTMPSCEDVPYIGSFAFANCITFKERFKVPVIISHAADNVITISIDAFVPAMAISVPVQTVTVALVISVAGCLLQSGDITGGQTLNLRFPYNDTPVDAQELAFPLPLPGGSLTVTAARLIYRGKENNMATKINDATFTSAGILNARYFF